MLEITRTHKIRLYPNDRQATGMIRACGIKRFVYNWGLATRKKLYSAGTKISGYALKKQFNSIKREEYPFVTMVSKCVADNALLDLEKAYNNFFKSLKKNRGNPKERRGVRYPAFKKKGTLDSFRIDNDKTNIKDGKLYMPKLGYIKMAEALRYPGRILSVTVSRTADRWFASISVEYTSCAETQGTRVCGIDLGIKHLAVTSDGTAYANPNNWNKDLKKLVRLSKSFSRKNKKSANWKKAKLKLGKYYMKLVDKRNDYIHKMTSELAKDYSAVCLEDLDVPDMVSNRRLSHKIINSLFGEIRRQLSYKTRVVVVDRFFPSTQLCPECGKLNKLKLSQRIYVCSCGYGPVDRDFHSARNILRAGCPEVKPVERTSATLSGAVLY